MIRLAIQMVFDPWKVDLKVVIIREKAQKLSRIGCRKGGSVCVKGVSRSRYWEYASVLMVLTGDRLFWVGTGGQVGWCNGWRLFVRLMQGRVLGCRSQIAVGSCWSPGCGRGGRGNCSRGGCKGCAADGPFWCIQLIC